MSAITTHGSKALYLPGVEAKPQPGVYRDLIEAARNRGAEYSTSGPRSPIEMETRVGP